MSTPRLDLIVEKGNRGHRRIENNWITCKDGTQLSVIAGGGTYSVPNPDYCVCEISEAVPGIKNIIASPNFRTPVQVPHDYPGPYTHVEVLFAGEDEDPKTWEVSKLRKLIESHGGEKTDNED